MTTAIKPEVLQRVEGLYGGMESFDRTAGEMGVDLSKRLATATDPDMTRKRYANVMYLSVASGKSPKEVLPVFDALRAKYAESVFGAADTDDATFYNLVSARFEKERAGRKMIHDMGNSMIEGALTGGKFEDVYRQLRIENLNNPGWNGDYDVQGVYENQLRNTWNDITQKAQAFAPIINEAETHFARSVGAGGEGLDELLDKLEKLDPKDAQFIIDTAAARQKKVKETAESTEGGKKAPAFFGDGVQNIFANKAAMWFGRESYRLATAAGEEVENLAIWHMFPWASGKAVTEKSNRDRLQHRIQSHITGELDPIKAESWWGQRMLETAQMLPYMLTASNYVTLPVAALALKNDAKHQLIDEGVPEDAAEKISLAATPLLAGIEHWEAGAALFGKGLGFKRLKKTTIKTLAARYATRLAAVQAGEVATEFTQDMIPPLMQDLWQEFDSRVPEPRIGEMAREWWKHSPELMASMLPLAGWGAGVGSARDGRLGMAATKYENTLRAMGFKEPDIENVIQAADKSYSSWYSAMRLGFQNADFKSPEAVNAQEHLASTIKAGEIPEGYDVTFTDTDRIRVTEKETGAVITESATSLDASQAILDAEFRRAVNEKASLSKPGEKSLGDAASDPLPDRPASTPEEDLAEYDRIQEENIAKINEIRGRKDLSSDEKIDAMDAARDEVSKIVESLKNRHFGGETPSKEIIEGMKQGKTPAEVQRPNQPTITPEQAVNEPKAAPESDEVPAIPTKTALNMKEIGMVRELFKLEQLPDQQRQTWASVFNAVKANNSWEGAISVADQILKDGRLPNPTEHAQMVIYMANAETRFEEALRLQARAIEEGNKSLADQKLVEAEFAKAEIDQITEAARMGGSWLGRALNIRKAAIERATYELVPLIQRASRVKGTALTNEEQQQLREFSEKILNLESEISRLNEELSALQNKSDTEGAAEFVNEGVRSRSKAGKESARSRRAAYKAELASLGFRMNAVNDNFSPKAMTLIAQIAETYIEEGASKLHEVTGMIKADIRDITDQDIYNALSGRLKSAKNQIKTEAENRVKDLKQQAKLWAEIHDALNGAFSDKKREAQTGSLQVQELRNILGKLKFQAQKTVKDQAQLNHLQAKLDEAIDMLQNGWRKLPGESRRRNATVEEKELRDKLRDVENIMRTQDAIADLNEQIRTGNYKISAGERKIVRSAELEDAQIKKRQLQREVEKRIKNMRGMTTGEKIVEGLMVPRALQSTLDLSFLGRQGLILAVNDPASAGKAFAGSLRAAIAEYNHDGIANAMENHPRYNEMIREYGIEFSELDAIATRREEHFMTNLAEKIPGAGAIVRAGNRAMITGLNILRFEATLRHMEALPNATRESKGKWGFYVNTASGKGQLGDFKQATANLNVAFYAPKYAVSRYQVLFAPINAWKEKETRNMIAADLAKFYLFWGGALLLAAGFGADVELDPESSDFGKIKVDNTRYDISGGMQQPMRLVALFGKGVATKGDLKRQPIDVMMSFLQYKTNPAVTLPYQTVTLTDFRGQDVTALEAVGNAVLPLVVQDIWDALKEDPAQAPAVAALGFVGVGASTYEKKSSKPKGVKYPD